MTQRTPLPSPVDLPPELQGRVVRYADDGTADVIFLPPAVSPPAMERRATPAVAQSASGNATRPISAPAESREQASAGSPQGEAESAGSGGDGSADPAPAPGVVAIRLADIRLGTLLLDSTARRLLGRVTKCGVFDAAMRGKARRKRIVIEMEEEQGHDR